MVHYANILEILISFLLTLSLVAPKPVPVIPWIYCIAGFMISLTTSNYAYMRKTFLINIVAVGALFLAKFNPAVVTRKFSLVIAFILCVNILWTITKVPKDIPAWQLWVFCICAVTQAVYPLFYAYIVRSTRFGITKNSVLLTPTFRPIMIATYVIWDSAFVMFVHGGFSGLVHNVFSVVAASVLAWMEGCDLADIELIWVGVRAIYLGGVLTTFIIRYEGGDREDKNVDVVVVDMFLVISFLLTVIGVVDLVRFYLREKEARKWD